MTLKRLAPQARKLATGLCISALLGSGAAALAQEAARAPSAPFTRGAELTVSRSQNGVAAVNGAIYAIGGLRNGRVLASVERFDPQTNAWKGVADLPEPRLDGVAVTCNAKIIFAAGFLDAGRSHLATKAFSYDPVMDQWTEVASPLDARGAPAAAGNGTQVFLASGFNLTEPAMRTAEVFDCAANRWTRLAPPPTGRQRAGGSFINGEFFVVGGRTANSAGRGQSNLNIVESFNPQTNQWTVRAPMPSSRSAIGVTPLDGTRLIALGGDGNPDRPQLTFPNAEVYDARADLWTRVSDLLSPAQGLGAATLNGRVFAAGGSLMQGPGASVVLQIFDPALESRLPAAVPAPVPPAALPAAATPTPAPTTPAPGTPTPMTAAQRRLRFFQQFFLRRMNRAQL
jgi:N-acetylneuraminic acid mutarotase